MYNSLNQDQSLMEIILFLIGWGYSSYVNMYNHVIVINNNS